MIKIDYSGIAPTPKPDKIAAEQVREKLRTHPMNGWVRLPYETEHLRHIIDVAGSVRRASDAVIVAGAGGSSLGARAVIDALGVADVPKFFWCGDNLSGTAMSRLLYALLGYENITVIVISKSGSTLETTVATRFLVPILQERHGDAAREHLIVITEPKQSPLRRFAETLGARTFDIPENVGGRYSVLSPVGLVPIAIAGVDIDELLRGAREQAER
ncbi:MAG: hypothetical protein LBN02_03135, partial [Oscillospiraceae bacterium]|nr:hypothetical protein [Oscillospiraceae bacterium]